MASHSSVLAWRVPWTEQPSSLRLLAVVRGDLTPLCVCVHQLEDVWVVSTFWLL